MQRYQVKLSPARVGEAGSGVLDAPSLATALIVADINLESGTAEIWYGERRVAALRKRGADRSTFWELF